MHFVSGSRSSAGDDQDRFGQAWRLRTRPDNEIPVTIGSAILLGRTDEVAVAVSDLRVYRNGLEVTVSARCRGRSARHGDLLSALGGFRHPRQRNAAEPFLLGFGYSDGRSATNVGQWPPGRLDFDDVEGPWLSHGSGGGSDRSADHEFFLAPLPPGDTLTLIAAWPGFGIAETKHVLDAAAIRTAAEQVLVLWPPDTTDDDDDEGEPPPPPVVPPGGWFDRT